MLSINYDKLEATMPLTHYHCKQKYSILTKLLNIYKQITGNLTNESENSPRESSFIHFPNLKPCIKDCFRINQNDHHSVETNSPKTP